ncbi:DUF3649 domain-containing protein [Terriglobus saanensis]|uniref:DUF3649 domain-containing protein n=1 Tax=Terriglobus saanensis (strain ATCC BAA-1853 / DSM 23119 / SP1PR4) TaxID=401053 RepID=E8V4C6_TERSS|nr:DUF3649 domain-containing protein [Terriglobus saanensis]ADV83675.1 hypothetical protein AciPR4_2914 [Terriglobus saanensis SP1PR4]
MVELNLPIQSRARKKDVTSRVCAALFGGYFAGTAFSMLVARLVPLAKVEATTTAILCTPILYVAAILWAFSARSPSRAWLVLILIAVIAGGLTLGLIIVKGRP